MSKPLPDLSTIPSPAHVLDASTQDDSKQWPWAVLAFIATLVFVIEILWIGQRTLLSQPEVRRVLEPMAAAAGFQLRAPALPDSWSVGQLTVEADSTHSGVWHFHAVLSHRARISQPWPVLELTLRDWQGQLIGRQHIKAEHYLPDDIRQDAALALLPPERRARVTVSVDLRQAQSDKPQSFEQATLVIAQ